VARACAGAARPSAPEGAGRVSVTTVATPMQPGPTRAPLPDSRPERFQSSDFIAAAIVFGVTLLVYVLTLAPSVTLEDSGELITGAAGFGVPHPPGYPLWTMSGYLFSHLIPFGNVAWRVNLQSAVFGAAANAVLTLLVCHSGRWLAQRWAPAEQQALARRWVFYIGLLTGCVIGFSDVMWSQGVISEVYTLNGLFVNLVLLFFYFWMLEPRKTHRLIVAVFVFALGLTNHHTLIQMIPAILIAAFLIQFLPLLLNVKPAAERGVFWSVLAAVELFSLSILVYLSWIATSNTEQLRQISSVMAVGIFIRIAVVSFFYLREFRPGAFAGGSAIAAAVFAYGHFCMSAQEGDNARYGPTNAPPSLWGSYVHPGWLQITTLHGIFLLALGMVALGLLWTSTLNRRMVFGVFAAGWVGLLPYTYESFASSTHPPMNWGVPASRSGFYYAVSRLQYPMSLPNLIMDKIGTAIGVVQPDAVHDAAISNVNYGHRLWLTLYYYGYNLQDNFTVPLIFLTLAILLYITRCDWRQVSWFVFLICAFFALGFMLHVISPPMAFDFQNNLNYNVFNLQSHCIFVILLGYGALAAVLYLHEMVPDLTTRFGPGGLGVPAMCLALLPLWSNFDDGNQANHWFGYQFGHDVMAPMDRNAVYYGGSDFGRFVPTFMAFVESQQNPRWKRDPSFDRRDVFVITQNALCDSYYTQYIRQQYDPRFRPVPKPSPSGQSRGYDQSKTDFLGDERYFSPFEEWLGRDTEYPQSSVLCLSPDELNECWSEYLARPEVIARIKSKEAARNGIRAGSNDVFEVNGIAAEKIFQKNKASHTFYVEQSVPMQWAYPYMLPSGLIFKLSPNKLSALPPEVVAADHAYWDAYAAELLADPNFRIDDDATLTFGKLAFFHADLYSWRHLKSDEEYFLKLALKLSPQLQDAVVRLQEIYLDQQRFDEALALLKQAQIDDPRNEFYADLVDETQRQQAWSAQEKKLRGDLAISPYDLAANLQLAKLLQEEGKTAEVVDRLRTAAALTNWDHDQMVDVVQYYVEQAHNTPAAIAFLQQRAKFDPGDSKLTYSLAALEGSVGRADEAIHDLALAAEASDGTNALMSAAVDQRFEPIQHDPRFQSLLGASSNAAAATKAAQQILAMPTNAPPKNPPATKPVPPVPTRNAPPLHPATDAAPLLAKKPKAG
jgi:tetratricopeptide (TPR) repeat protein